MTEQQLILHFASVDVSLFKITRFDVIVFRHNKSGKKAGINRQEKYVPMSIVGLCKKLRVKCPNGYEMADRVLDDIIDDSHHQTGEGGSLPAPSSDEGENLN